MRVFIGDYFGVVHSNITYGILLSGGVSQVYRIIRFRKKANTVIAVSLCLKTLKSYFSLTEIRRLGDLRKYTGFCYVSIFHYATGIYLSFQVVFYFFSPFVCVFVDAVPNCFLLLLRYTGCSLLCILSKGVGTYRSAHCAFVY